MDAALIDAAIDALATEGWCVLEGVLPEEATAALARECAALHASGDLAAARIGREKVASALRGDHTRWFDMDAPTSAQRPYVEMLETLRVAFNRGLMLGLVEGEAHYAVYPPGARYARHLDQPHQLEARVISAVYYLNADWREADGGALRLYLDDGSHRDVLPHTGRMVLFLSARFEHEVLPATRERMSIACWMRRRERGSVF